jgi:hypothetical protein
MLTTVRHQGIPAMAKPTQYSYTPEDVAIAVSKPLKEVEKLAKDVNFEDLLAVTYFIAANAPQKVRQNLASVSMGMKELTPDLWEKRESKGISRTSYNFTLKDIEKAGGISVNTIYQHQFRGYVDLTKVLSLAFYLARYASGDIRHKITNICMGLQTPPTNG